MESKIIQLKEILDRMNRLINAKAPNSYWASKINDFSCHTITRRNADDFARSIRGCYGGMGSLGDTVLHNGNPAEKREFRELQSELYKVCSAINQYDINHPYNPKIYIDIDLNEYRYNCSHCDQDFLGPLEALESHRSNGHLLVSEQGKLKFFSPISDIYYGHFQVYLDNHKLAPKLKALNEQDLEIRIFSRFFDSDVDDGYGDFKLVSDICCPACASRDVVKIDENMVSNRQSLSLPLITHEKWDSQNRFLRHLYATMAFKKYISVGIPK